MTTIKWVDCRSGKISAVCSILLRQKRSIFGQFTGCTAGRHCAQLFISIKFFEEEIFRGNKLSRAAVWLQNRKNFCPLKFPAVQYLNFSPALPKNLYQNAQVSNSWDIYIHSFASWHTVVCPGHLIYKAVRKLCVGKLTFASIFLLLNRFYCICNWLCRSCYYW